MFTPLMLKPLVSAWKASSVAISAAEISTALQQGTIDGAISSIPYWINCCRDTAPYFTTGVLVVYVSHVLCTNNTFWQKLPPDVQKVIQQCVDQATAESRKEKERLDLALLAKYQVKNPEQKGVYVLTSEERKEWDKAAQGTYPAFKAILGQEVYDMAIDFIKTGK